MTSSETFGERVRRLREVKRPKLERRILADLIAMPYSTLAEIENQGKESTKVAYLPKLADALGVSIRELCTGSADGHETAPSEPPVTARERDVVRAFRAMTAGEKQGLEAYIASLAARPTRSKRKARAAAASGSQERSRKAS